MWCIAAERLLPATATMTPELIRMLVALLGGVAVYGGVARLLRAPELVSLLGMLRRGR
jgi:hypothetical protein